MRTVQVGAQISGRIDSVAVDYNEHVKAGQVLAQFDLTPLLAQLSQAQATLNAVALEGGEEAFVMIRFEQFLGRYPLHCHNLEHEDHAMMSRFDVV